MAWHGCVWVPSTMIDFELCWANGDTIVWHAAHRVPVDSYLRQPRLGMVHTQLAFLDDSA